MKKITVICFASLALMGCAQNLACKASMTLIGCPSHTLNKGLPLLNGKPIEYAISYMGHPNGEQTVAGQMVYIWDYGRRFTTTETVRSPISGSGYGASGGFSYQGYQTSHVPKHHNYYCTIRLIVNDKKEIVRSDWNGNEGGCGYYSNAVERIIDNIEARKAQGIL